MKPPHAIGSVPSLSGHAIANRWRSLPRARRHRACKPQGSFERVLPWQITMDQFIFASLSHTHYWYEVGMLKIVGVQKYSLPIKEHISPALEVHNSLEYKLVRAYSLLHRRETIRNIANFVLKTSKWSISLTFAALTRDEFRHGRSLSRGILFAMSGSVSRLCRFSPTAAAEEPSSSSSSSYPNWLLWRTDARRELRRIFSPSSSFILALRHIYNKHVDNYPYKHFELVEGCISQR